MINIIQTPQFKIYRDNKLSRWETFKPVLDAKIQTCVDNIDYFFIEGKLPIRQK